MTIQFPPRAIVAATLAACAAAPAFAQSILSPVVVTAARMPQSAKDVLGDTLVITADEIAASGHRSLVELLQAKRGIEIARNGGPGSVASVFVRGTANYQTVVLIDGVRAGSATLGGATWESLPLSQVERIEIVYGPQSSLYGADAMGGVVQIFTRQGEAGQRRSLSVGAGSYGERLAEASLSGGSADAHRFRYSLSAAHQRADGFSASKPGAGPWTYNADRDGYSKNSATANFSMLLAPGLDAALTLLNSRVDAQFDAGAGYDDRTEQEAGSYALTLKRAWMPEWTSALQVARADDKGKTFASYGAGFINTKQNQFSLQNDITIGRDVLQVVLERREEKVDTDSAGLARERSTNSVAASYHLRQGDHLVSLAGRSDDNSQFGRHSTGSAEYGYRIAPSWRAGVSAGTSFRAPSFNELYYPGYGVASNQPERGRNVEASLTYGQGGASFAAVAYRNRLRNLLQYAPVCPVEPATHAYGCAYNIGSATLSGLSLSAALPLGNWRATAALDLQNAKDDSNGKRLPRRARQHGSVGLEYAAGGLRMGAETVFAGARFDDGANLNRLPGYGQVNVYASQALGGNWSVFGRWNNVLDRDYELVKNYATAGSSVFIGLRYAMK